MKKLIKVTQKDINNGILQEADQCPVARAICRAFKKGRGYSQVTDDTFDEDELNKILLGFGHSKVIKQPKSVKHFVRRFDSGRRVKPFEFVLEY